MKYFLPVTLLFVLFTGCDILFPGTPVTPEPTNSPVAQTQEPTATPGEPFSPGEKEIAKLLAYDGKTMDHFGFSVSISGDYAAVGVHGDDDNGSSAGSVYIFGKNQGGADNWGGVKKIIASDGAAHVRFGISVSISGDYVVVGAHGDDEKGEFAGSAYIFSKNQGGTDNWGEVKKITASDARADDGFGSFVSIRGDYAVICAPGDDEYIYSSIESTDVYYRDIGSIYIFYRNQGGENNWGEMKKIIPSDAAAIDRFSSSVSICGDYVVVGAYRYNDSGAYSGSAYIFGRNQSGENYWGQIKKITAINASPGDRFGSSVSISGDYIVVGAYNDDENGVNAGSAYIFGRNQGRENHWGEVKKITASDAAADDVFGSSTSISGDYIVVGAHGDDDKGENAGSAYIFSRDQGGISNWGEIKKITASDAAADDIFGSSVSISGDYVVIGAHYDEKTTGAAYIFSRDF